MKRAESLQGPLYPAEGKFSSFVNLLAHASARARCIASVLVAAATLGMLSVLWSAPASAIEYIYDELGRVVGVVDSTGASARYNYDGLGNIVSIDRFGAATISILPV